jgi:hypothetical protein
MGNRCLYTTLFILMTAIFGTVSYFGLAHMQGYNIVYTIFLTVFPALVVSTVIALLTALCIKCGCESDDGQYLGYVRIR